MRVSCAFFSPYYFFFYPYFLRFHASRTIVCFYVPSAAFNCCRSLSLSTFSSNKNKQKPKILLVIRLLVLVCPTLEQEHLSPCLVRGVATSPNDNWGGARRRRKKNLQRPRKDRQVIALGWLGMVAYPCFFGWLHVAPPGIPRGPQRTTIVSTTVREFALQRAMIRGCFRPLLTAHYSSVVCAKGNYLEMIL